MAPEDTWFLDDTPVFWFHEPVVATGGFVPSGMAPPYRDYNPYAEYALEMLRIIQRDLMRRGDVGGATDNG